MRNNWIKSKYWQNISFLINIFKDQKLFLIILLMIQIITGTSPIIITWFNSKLIDYISISNNISYGIEGIIIIIISSVLLIAINDFFIVIHHFFADYFKNIVYNRVQLKLLNTISSHPDHKLFENPECNNLIVLSKQNTKIFSENIDVASQMLVVFFNLISAILLGFSIALWIPVLLLLTMIPFIYFRTSIENSIWNVKERHGAIINQIDLYEKMLTEFEFSKEIRLYSMQSYLLNKWQKLYEQFSNSVNNIRIRGCWIVGFWALFSGVGLLITFWYVSQNAIAGKISIGKLSLLIGIIMQLNGSMTAIMYNGVDVLKSFILVKPIMQLTEIKETHIDYPSFIPELLNPIPLLLFDEVSFSYPGTMEAALNNISLSINENESTAVVGANGSGKSTLVKLLCRFYQPNKGKIYWKGQDINSIDFKLYRSKIRALFQDFTQFPLSVRDNITLALEDKDNIKIIKQVLKEVELEFLIDKLDCIMHKSTVNGIELSGGQKQRLALARVLANIENREFLIFDEPTSALDANTEYKINSLISQIMKTKTSMIISHRLALCKSTDKIIVLDKGNIVEYGNHKELIELKSLYYQLFQKQASWYI